MRATGPHDAVVVIGKESSGKSCLVGALTGASTYAANFRGSTVECETYDGPDRTFIDTPGILHRSDSDTTRAALACVRDRDSVILVARTTSIINDLRDLLPLVVRKHGIIIGTFWDRARVGGASVHGLADIERQVGVKIYPVDARNITADYRADIIRHLNNPQQFLLPTSFLPERWRVEAPSNWLDHGVIGKLLAVALLIVPAGVIVGIANTLAGLLDPPTQHVLADAVRWCHHLPLPLRDVLTGRFGMFTMGPLLLLWAAPTVLLYSLLFGVYKASGLLDRLTVTLDAWTRVFGLSGRDFLRVIMGFGCNVPAVISTRACSRCSRGSCISVIAFGSACSYQQGATFAVFAAVGHPWLALPYVLYLSLTCLLFAWATKTTGSTSSRSLLVLEERAFLTIPRSWDVWQEAKRTLVPFVRKALPVFVMITVVASALDSLHVIDHAGRGIAPVMRLFQLPPECAIPLVLACVRKDGILLFASQDQQLSAGQVLTGVYLAGVFLPCLVTVITIAREQSLAFAGKLLVRQAAAAALFAAILGWVVRLVS